MDSILHVEGEKAIQRLYKIKCFTLLKALTVLSLVSPLMGVYDTRYWSTWALGWTQVTSILTAVSSEMDKLLGPPPDTKAAQTKNATKLFMYCSQSVSYNMCLYTYRCCIVWPQPHSEPHQHIMQRVKSDIPYLPQPLPRLPPHSLHLLSAGIYPWITIYYQITLASC